MDIQAAQWHTASRVSPKLVSKEFNNNKNRKEFNNSLKDLLSATTTSKECNDKGCPKIPTLQFLNIIQKGRGVNPLLKNCRVRNGLTNTLVRPKIV